VLQLAKFSAWHSVILLQKLAVPGAGLGGRAATSPTSQLRGNFGISASGKFDSGFQVPGSKVCKHLMHALLLLDSAHSECNKATRKVLGSKLLQPVSVCEQQTRICIWAALLDELQNCTFGKPLPEKEQSCPGHVCLLASSQVAPLKPEKFSLALTSCSQRVDNLVGGLVGKLGGGGGGRVSEKRK